MVLEGQLDEVPWPARKMSKWVLEQIMPQTLLRAQMTGPQLSSFRHTLRRQGPWKKTVTLGTTEGREADEIRDGLPL